MPVDRGVIDAQLRDIGEGERWWEQREFRDLPHVLRADERIHGLVNGKLLGRRRPRLRPGRPWLIIATDQRLICLQQERFARRQIELAAGQITRFDQRSGLRSYQITMGTSQRTYRIRIPKAEAFRFVGALGPLMPHQSAPRPHTGLEPLSWIPGFNAFAALPGVSGIVSRATIVERTDYASREHVERLEAAVDGLQVEVERLREHVSFLEDLLQKRAEESFLPAQRGDR